MKTFTTFFTTAKIEDLLIIGALLFCTLGGIYICSIITISYS